MAFDRPTLDELIARVEAEFSARLGIGPLLERSALKAIARVVAGQGHLLNAYIAWAVDQVFPDTADAENLARWASIFGVLRKAAVSAEGPVVFTGTEASSIPLGTLLRRVDGAEFETTAAGVISGGTATVDVAALEPGAAGDTAATTELELVSPVSGIDSSATVDSGGITGGADRESDEDLLSRLLIRLQTPPQGGSEADYIAWALEVAGVTRAWCLPIYFGLGTVGVTFLVDDDPAGPIPDGAKVAEVQAYIDDETRRPVTADVTVFAPTEVNLDPEIVLVPDTGLVRAAVEASLVDMLRAQTSPGGTILLSKIREAISTAEGEEDHELVSPVADVTVNPGEIVTLGTVTWS